MRTVHKTYQDPQRAYPVGICSQCGRDLYPGSPCWRLCGQSLCGDCLLPWLMGGFLAGAGVLAVIDSVLAGEYRRLDTKLSSSGVLMLMVGLAIIVRGSGADGLIGVAWGIFGLIQGSESLNVAIYNLAGRKKWGMDMLQAAVQIGLALLLLVDPVTKLYPHMRILGLELLAMGFHIFREIRAAS